MRNSPCWWHKYPAPGARILFRRSGYRECAPAARGNNCRHRLISAGGHSIQGETSEEAIAREALEELGYNSHDFSNDRPYLTINYDDGFGDVYIVIDDELDINQLRLQKEEVQCVTWANKNEVLQLIEEGKFIPYCPGFIELLFFNKDKRGLINE